MKIEEMIAAKRSDCAGCEACANVCPRGAIEMTADAEGFYYPRIDKRKCVECGRCDRTCPVLNAPERPSKPPIAIAAVNRDWNVRRKSSSGGTFTALAEIVLKRGGIIFGAAFDEQWNVVHISVDAIDGLDRLRGSKYVQSRIGDVYRRVKAALDSDRDVMFVGTPCQIAGLKNFLGRDHDRLTLVDTACKGITPPVLWKTYVDYRGRGHEIVNVNFRDKQSGWENSFFKIVYRDCPHYSAELNKDLFGQGFGLGLTLRPSCSACHFKGSARISDITLADFWGVRKVQPEMFDNRGTSLVLIHSDKGARLINETNLIRRQTDLSKAVENNPCLITSFPADERRAEFFKALATPNANPIAVLDQFYLYDYRKEAQRLAALLKPQKILILTTWWEGGGSNVFLDYRAREIYNGAGVYVLTQSDNADRHFVISNYRKPDEKISIAKDFDALTSEVKRLGITRLFVNNFVTFDIAFITRWVSTCGLPYEYFIHDYLCVCANYILDCFCRYCGESGTNKFCRHHLNKHVKEATIEQWREMFGRLLSRAEHVYAPSTYAAKLVKKYLPSLNIEVQPHKLSLPLSKTFRAEFAMRDRLRIVFPGFMRREKGEAYLLIANQFIRENGLPIELIVLGEYRDDVKNVGSKDGIVIAGKYDNRKTSELLSKYETALVAVLSMTYETYCYTASEAILSGYPVLSMNIGAQAIRIRKNDCGWLLPINDKSGGVEALKKFLRFIVTLEGRQQILSKATNTAKFINGTE